MKRIPHENTPRVIVLALAVVALIAGLAAADGVFAKFAFEELAGYAAFGIGFAVLTYVLDYRVRSVVRGWLGLERRREPRERTSRHRLRGDLA